MAANNKIIATLPAVDINRAKKFYRASFGFPACL